MLNIKTQEDYNKIIESIKECIDFFNNRYPEDNKYTLYLSNGKKINYSINKNNIPHLIGVNINRLISTNIFRKDTSYNVLEKFIYENYSIYRKIVMGGGYLKYSDIFSDFIEYKLESFKEQLRPPYPNEIYFVCEYDTTKTYLSKEVDEYTSDYYIARKSQNGDIILLGLKRKANNEYAVQTSRIIKNDEHQLQILKEFLNDQVVTFINGLIVENYQTCFHKQYNIGIEDKKEIIQNLIGLSRKTHSIPNTIENHLFDIVSVSRVKNNDFNKKIILSQLVDSMKNSQIFDLNEIDEDIRGQLDEEILEVIENYNDYICSSPVVNDDNTQKYSMLLHEKNNLESENENLNKRLENIQNQLESLKKEKEELKKYKELYMDFTTKIYGLIDEEQNKSKI